MNTYDTNRAGGRKQAASSVLLVVLALTGIVMSIGIFLQLMNVSACSDPAATCDYSALDLAMWLTPVALVSTFAASVITLIASRRTSKNLWWVPALGCALTISACIIASSLINGAIRV